MSSGQFTSIATPSRRSNWAATSRSAAAASRTVDCWVRTRTTTPAITSSATAVRIAIRPTFDFCGGPAGGPNCCPGAAYGGPPYAGAPYAGAPYAAGPYAAGPYAAGPYGAEPYWVGPYGRSSAGCPP